MSKELLTCFFTECESRLRFLEVQHGYQYFSGLSTMAAGRQIIHPYKGQDVSRPFFATTRYEKGRNAIEISYGDNDYMLSAHLHINFIHRLHINDLLKASHKHDVTTLPPLSVSQATPLKSSLHFVSDLFKEHPETLIEPSDKLIEKAMSIRGKLLEEKVRQHYRAMMDTVCLEAAKAFVRKDYARVIELYTPYEKDLGAADRKKLEQARQKMNLPL